MVLTKCESRRGITPPPPKDQAGRDTVTAGDIGNRHARLGGFLQNGQLLIDRITSTTYASQA
jgi:hypothetical protein